MSIGYECDADLHCTFTNTSVCAYDPYSCVNKLQECRDKKTSIWRLPEQPTNALLHDNSTWDLPSSKSLISYYHDNADFLGKETWCKEIDSGNYSTWPVLTFELATTCVLDADETIKGTMSQKRKIIRSIATKNKDSIKLTINATKKIFKSKEVHIFIRHSSKMH